MSTSSTRRGLGLREIFRHGKEACLSVPVVNGSLRWSAPTTFLLKEPFCRGNVAPSAEHELNRLALRIDRPVQVLPFTTDLHVCFVYAVRDATHGRVKTGASHTLHVAYSWPPLDQRGCGHPPGETGHWLGQPSRIRSGHYRALT